MPYNNAAIPPPEETSGQTVLPMTRIKKIIRLDDDIAQCSNNAAFVISVATEMFIQYLAEQGHNVVKSERKPRKNIQYRDLATAVSRIDNLEFLSDVIPKTTTYKQFKEKKAKETSRKGGVQKGQKTLNGKKKADNGFKGPGKDGTSILQTNGDYSDGPGAGAASSHRTTMVDRTVESAGRAQPDNEDVDMTE